MNGPSSPMRRNDFFIDAICFSQRYLHLELSWAVEEHGLIHIEPRLAEFKGCYFTLQAHRRLFVYEGVCKGWVGREIPEPLAGKRRSSHDKSSSQSKRVYHPEEKGFSVDAAARAREIGLCTGVVVVGATAYTST